VDLNEPYGVDGPFGVTKFADLTSEEFEKFYLLPNPPNFSKFVVTLFLGS
jgi:hypothetical protein